MTNLGTLGTDPVSFGQDINDVGQVIGDSGVLNLTTFEFVESHAFIWENGTITSLGTLGGAESFAHTINNAGQVVGDSEKLSGDFHAFIWENGTMTDLGTLGNDPNSFAEDINDVGQVIGDSGGLESEDFDFFGFVDPSAFIWEDGTITPLGTLPGDSFSSVIAINELGQVVGDSYNFTNDVHGFFWENGTMTEIGLLGGANVLVEDINDAGQVIGSIEIDIGGGLNETHAFIWNVNADPQIC